MLCQQLQCIVAKSPPALHENPTGKQWHISEAFGGKGCSGRNLTNIRGKKGLEEEEDQKVISNREVTDCGLQL